MCTGQSSCPLSPSSCHVRPLSARAALCAAALVSALLTRAAYAGFWFLPIGEHIHSFSMLVAAEAASLQLPDPQQDTQLPMPQLCSASSLHTRAHLHSWAHTLCAASLGPKLHL